MRTEDKACSPDMLSCRPASGRGVAGRHCRRDATGIYGLHEGDIRILYEVDAEPATVYIINIGAIS